MNTTVANPVDPLAASASDQEAFRKFLTYSLILHGLLFLFIALSIYLKFGRDEWSGVGGDGGNPTKVKLVGSVSGIPLPPKPSVTESTTADPSNDLFAEETPPKSLPLPPKEPVKPADKIPEFKHEKPLPETHKSKVDRPKTPVPDNAVPGRGAPPPIPTSSMQPPGSGVNPVTVQGQGGGGDFASRYGWYIQSVVGLINRNWDQTSIDPAWRAAHRGKTVMTFKIARDGTVHSIAMAQSSGNLSLDNSARRTLEGIRFGPLPNDYGWPSVDVTFDFDLTLVR
jgi:TonB family protein